MQKYFTRRRSLVRKAAAMMSAVMLFTSEAGMFPGNPAVVNAADDEVREEGVAEKEADENSVITASDGDFSITVSKLQYGEDGSNEKGNLDAIFAPRLIADGAELKPGTDYSVSYKFFAAADEAEAVSKENFAEAEGIELACVDAGTEIYAVVKAVAADAEYMVSVKLTVAKRLISVSYKASEDAAIEGRDVAEDGSYVIPAEDVDYSGFDLSFADGFAYDVDASAFLSGDVTLDLSGVDLSVDSLSTVPMNVELDPEVEDNYELDMNIHGDYYITKAQYYVVFTANNNGETYTRTYAFPSYDFSGTAAELLEGLGKTDEILSKDGEAYTLNGFLEPVTDTLVGWTAYVDGFNASKAHDYTGYQSGDSYSTVNVNADASTYEQSGSTRKLTLNGKRDYLFVAEISKAAADNIYVSVIPSVFYDTRAHVALGSKAKAKKEVADLRIKVSYSESGKQDGVEYDTELINGTDYTIEYFNNTDASMTVSDNGIYVPVKTGDSRPHVKITGKGRYNGFEAIVYFDILPVNLGASEWSYEYLHEKDSGNYDGHSYDGMDRPYTYMGTYKANCNGINKATYILKKGKISGINLKVSKSFYNYGYDKNYERTSYTYATLTLAEGRDYQVELYKWNAEGNCWELKEGITDPNKLTEAGDYLCLIRGIGNYCGAIFDGNADNEFASGKDTGERINPLHNLSDRQQFRIAEDMSHDLSTASISIGVKSVNWDGIKRDAVSFNIVVKDKNRNELKYGVDYTVSFERKYGNRNGANSGSWISASNKYTVKISGIGDYYNYKRGGKVTIKGTKLNKKWFEMSGSSVTVTAAGIAAGVVMDNNKDPHYVGYYNTYASSGKITVHVGGARYKGNNSNYDSYSGEAFDPVSSVKLKIKAVKSEKMKLSDAIRNGYITFTVSDNGGYNIKGAVPDSISYTSGKSGSGYWSEYDLYNGCQIGVSVYEPDSYNSLGHVNLIINIKNNKKVDGKAEVTAKVADKNSFLTGSAKIGSFTVSAREILTIGDYHNYIPDVYDMANSSVFAVVTDELKSKGSLSKPNVKLYQVYRDKNGTKHAGALNAKQYEVVPGNELGSNHIAISTYAANGTASGFNFVPSFETAPGAYVGVFALYNARLTAADITAVNISGLSPEYAVNNGQIDNTYAPEFTGQAITPFIDRIKTVKGGLDFASDYKLGFGDNIAAGEKGGKVYISTMYNKTMDTYEYGGTVEISFKITPAKAIQL